MNVHRAVIRSLVLVAGLLLSIAPLARATDAGRIDAGDTVVVAADGAEFYVEQKIAARLPKATEIKVIEVSKPWVGASVPIDGQTKAGWIHSRKIFKRDNPASVDALKKLEDKKVKLEPNYLGSILRLDANDSEITGEALVHIKGLYDLEGLELSGTKIADDDLANLTGLTNLQWLYLDNTKISDKGIAHLKGLANLDVLALNKTEVTGSGLAQLKDLKRLRVLNLSDCKITDAALENIRGLVQIQTLALQSAPITGEGLKHFQGMPRLNVLNLNHTKLAAGSLSNLKECKELRILHLEGAEVDADDRKVLDDALPSLAIFD